MFALLRKAVTATALTAALVSGGAMTMAAPAQAATAVSFCFTWAQTGAAYSGYPVFLYSVDGTGRAISQLRSGRTNSSGCGTFSSTPSGVQLRVFAGVGAGGHYWSGQTPSWATAGTGGVWLGYGRVYQMY